MGRTINITIGAALAAALVLPTVALAGAGASMSDTQDLGSQGLGAGLVVRESNGISYVSGGVGDEQQTALAAASKQFNLKLTLAGTTGHYMGGAEIRIDDTTGKTLLATSATGPMFLAKLPSGTYKVHATADGKTNTRDVTIPRNGQKQFVMTWPDISAEPVRAGDAPEAK